jgi:hypothetical protein
MKISAILLLIFISSVASGQTIDKQLIQQNYNKGLMVAELIDKSDTASLNEVFHDEDQIMELIKKNNSIDQAKDPLEPSTDIYYDPNSKCFVFTIYKGKPVNNGTEWGLYDYLYVVELLIDPENENDPFRKSRIIPETEMKQWWQSLMESYKNKNNLRKEWADKYDLVPPPPPPPQTEQWFKK